MTLEQLTEAQHKANVLTEVTNALNDSTKVLSDNVIRDLLHFAGKTVFASDATMPHRVASAHHEVQRLHKLVVAIWNRELALQHDLDQIRRYHGFTTAEALKEAVEAGQRAPVPATPVTPAHHVTVSDRDKVLEVAKERAKEAQAKAAHAAHAAQK